MTAPDIIRLRALVDLDPLDTDALAALIRAYRQRGALEEAAMLGDAQSICDLSNTHPHWRECALYHFAYYPRAVSGLPTLIRPGVAGGDILLRAEYPAWIMQAPARARIALMCVAYGLADTDKIAPPSVGPREALLVEYCTSESVPPAGASRADLKAFRPRYSRVYPHQRLAWIRAECRFYNHKGVRNDVELEAEAPVLRRARLRLAQIILDRLLLPDQGFGTSPPPLFKDTP